MSCDTIRLGMLKRQRLSPMPPRATLRNRFCAARQKNARAAFLEPAMLFGSFA